MKLYYEVTDDGYHIYDEENSLFHIHQYEPYIPHRNLSYEENAKLQIEELMTPPEPQPNPLEDRVAELEAVNEELSATLDAILTDVIPSMMA